MEVVLNADDFGHSSEINRAVLQAHREGVLTSASLMVTGDAAEEAVEMARATPTLAVGLHLVLSDGQPALPPEELPHLLRGRDRFPAGAARVWIRYIFSGAARREMACEVRAQFERFAAMGLPLDHVDGHQHIHMQPAVFHMLLPLARQYGASGVRLPRDDFGLAMRYDRRDAAVKAVWAAVFGILCRRYAGELDGWAAGSRQTAGAHRVTAADRVYGLMQSGRMEEAYVLNVLARAPGISTAQNVTLPSQTGPGSGRMTPKGHSDLAVGSSQSGMPARGRAGTLVVELYFHPTLASASVPLGPNRGDLATLLSPAVRQAIEERGWVRATYAALQEAR
jgi:hopanoid biosynthesis associated protein HpnK